MSKDFSKSPYILSDLLIPLKNCVKVHDSKNIENSNVFLVKTNIHRETPVVDRNIDVRF